MKTIIAMSLAIMCATANASSSIYYVDASFGGASGPALVKDMRIESALHALAMIGRTPMQSDVMPGASIWDFRDSLEARVDEWNLTGENFAPRHVIVGLTGTAFFPGERPKLNKITIEMATLLQERAPDTIMWAVDYPPYDGFNAEGRKIMPDRTAYELWRRQYRLVIWRLPNAKLICGALRDWESSGRYHPLLPDGDYHLSEESAINAALRIYTTIRDSENPDW